MNVWKRGADHKSNFGQKQKRKAGKPGTNYLSHFGRENLQAMNFRKFEETQVAKTLVLPFYRQFADSVWMSFFLRSCLVKKKNNNSTYKYKFSNLVLAAIRHVGNAE